MWSCGFGLWCLPGLVLTMLEAFTGDRGLYLNLHGNPIPVLLALVGVWGGIPWTLWHVTFLSRLRSSGRAIPGVMWAQVVATATTILLFFGHSRW
ncbi:MAG: hypothetical protein AB7N24_23850 [Dehalococcoidia bacterium]